MIEFENLAKTNQLFFEKYYKKIPEIFQKGMFILASEVENFEKEFAEFSNSKYCLGVASGLDALILGLEAIGIRKGDEVIVSANSYIACILSIVRVGAIPVLVEPSIKNYNIDPEKISEKITNKTRAIMVVHMYGKMCDMPKIIQIAKKNNLKIIEDAAQAHGAKCHNEIAGSVGDIAAFSFYPTKNLGALGDAGAVITNNANYHDLIIKTRNYGFGKVRYSSDEIGYNSRLDEIQAAFLRIKLQKLHEINEHKRSLAKIYFEMWDKNKFILPEINNSFYDIYHIFNIRNDKRDNLKRYLESHQISTVIHYPIPLHQQKSLKSFFKKDLVLPIAQNICDTTLSLPIAYFHSENDIEKICKIINGF